MEYPTIPVCFLKLYSQLHLKKRKTFVKQQFLVHHYKWIPPDSRGSRQYWSPLQIQVGDWFLNGLTWWDWQLLPQLSHRPMNMCFQVTLAMPAISGANLTYQCIRQGRRQWLRWIVHSVHSDLWDTSGNSDFALAYLVMPFAALPVIGYI